VPAWRHLAKGLFDFYYTSTKCSKSYFVSPEVSFANLEAITTPSYLHYYWQQGPSDKFFLCVYMFSCGWIQIQNTKSLPKWSQGQIHRLSTKFMHWSWCLTIVKIFSWTEALYRNHWSTDVSPLHSVCLPITRYCKFLHTRYQWLFSNFIQTRPAACKW